MGNKNSELISVIIPVYNVEKYLSKCIDSVIHQTYQNLEIILIDDGSIDNSGSMCDDYSKIDNRIIVRHKKNGGQGSARNLGLQLATGKYLMFLDSDDSLKLDCIDFLYSRLLKNNLQVICCNSDNYNENGKFLSKRTKGPEFVILDGIQTIQSLWYGEYINIAPWGKLFRTEVWDNNKFVECYGEDFATMHKIYLPLTRVAYCNDSKLNYLVRGNSDIHSFQPSKIELLKIARENLKFAEDHPELHAAALCKAESVFMHVLYQLPNTDEYADLKNEIKEFILKNRKEVILDKRARGKTRYALIISYINLQLPNFLLNVLHKFDASF